MNPNDIFIHECPECSGSGVLEEDACPLCEGLGRVAEATLFVHEHPEYNDDSVDYSTFRRGLDAWRKEQAYYAYGED